MSEKFVDLGSKKWIHKTLAYLSSPETPTENSSVHRTQWISQRKLNILCVSAYYWCKIEYNVYIIQGTRSITNNLAIYLMKKYSLDKYFNTEIKESKLNGEIKGEVMVNQTCCELYFISHYFETSFDD